MRYAFGGTVDFTSGSCGIASCFPDGVFVARMKKVFDGIRTGKHDVGGGTRRLETRLKDRTPRAPLDMSARARRAGGVLMCARGEMSEDFPDFCEETMGQKMTISRKKQRKHFERVFPSLQGFAQFDSQRKGKWIS